ncbi:MAG: hypothetical protein IPN29_13815 [Saprospiraceae bacterium]|nr:hypothetical protein [Saprospiraceae bacterium]
MQKSNVLLLTLFKEKEQKGVITGKFYEYLRAGKPIIAFGYTQSDAALLLEKFNSGNIFEYDEIDRLTVYIEKLFSDYHHNKKMVVDEKISDFSRAHLAKKYADLIVSAI